MSEVRAHRAVGSEPIGAICSDVEAYYTERVVRHGATPLGVDWSCQATQDLRFVQLLKVCGVSEPKPESESWSLNDLGCGYGALVPFLARRYPSCHIDYLGIDLSRAMISRARRRFSVPGRRFVVGTQSPRVADYSVASGIMNVNVGHTRVAWERFIEAMITQMSETSTRGFAVNFMLAEGAVQADEESGRTRLYRTSPDRWTSYCESELGCSVDVLSAYGMKEFTLLVRHRTDTWSGAASRA